MLERPGEAWRGSCRTLPTLHLQQVGVLSTLPPLWEEGFLLDQQLAQPARSHHHHPELCPPGNVGFSFSNDFLALGSFL